MAVPIPFARLSSQAPAALPAAEAGAPAELCARLAWSLVNLGRAEPLDHLSTHLFQQERARYDACYQPLLRHFTAAGCVVMSAAALERAVVRSRDPATVLLLRRAIGMASEPGAERDAIEAALAAAMTAGSDLLDRDQARAFAAAFATELRNSGYLLCHSSVDTAALRQALFAEGLAKRIRDDLAIAILTFKQAYERLTAEPALTAAPIA